MLLSICTIANAQDYALVDAITSVQKLNEEIKALDEDLVRSKAEVGKAVSSFLPDFSANQSYGRIDLENAADYVHQRNKNLAVEHVLFQSGTSFGQFVGAKRAFSAVQNNYIVGVQEIYFRAVQAYEQYLTSIDILHFAIKREELLKNQLELNQTRFDYEDIPKTDLLQARAAYANAIANKEIANGNMISAKAQLEGVLYSEVPAKVRNIDHKHIEQFLPKTLEELMTEVNNLNPYIKAQQYSYEAAKAGVYVATTSILPRVVGKYEWFEGYDDQSGINRTKGQAATVQIRIPIIPNGGADFFSIKQSNSDKHKALASYRAARQNIEAEAIVSWNEYVASESVRMAAYETMIAEYETLEGFKEEAKVGARDIIQVLEIEQRYFDAQVTHRKSVQSKIVAEFKLLSLLGKLYNADYLQLSS